MRYNQLGRTGLLVSEFCLGAMSFGRNDAHWSGRGQYEQSAVDEVMKAAFTKETDFFADRGHSCAPAARVSIMLSSAGS